MNEGMAVDESLPLADEIGKQKATSVSRELAGLWSESSTKRGFFGKLFGRRPHRLTRQQLATKLAAACHSEAATFATGLKTRFGGRVSMSDFAVMDESISFHAWMYVETLGVEYKWLADAMCEEMAVIQAAAWEVMSKALFSYLDISESEAKDLDDPQSCAASKSEQLRSLLARVGAYRSVWSDLGDAPRENLALVLAAVLAGKIGLAPAPTELQSLMHPNQVFKTGRGVAKLVRNTELLD